MKMKNTIANFLMGNSRENLFRLLKILSYKANGIKIKLDCNWDCS